MLLRMAAAAITTLVLGPVLAVGISKGVMHAYWHFWPQMPRGDEASGRGDTLIFARSVLGSLAAVGLARILFDLIQAPASTLVVIVLACTFLAGDAFLLRLSLQAYHLTRRRVPQTLYSAIRHSIARIGGDLVGFFSGALWFLRP